MIPYISPSSQPSTQTPTSNTGSNRQDLHGTGLTCKLDYLVLTGFGDTEALLDLVWAATGTNWDYDKARPGTRGIYYDLILRSSSTIEIAIKFNRDDATQNQYRLSIPGSPLGDLSSATLASFGQQLHAFGCRATRFDWAIDDYDRSISVDFFEKAGLNNNYSGAREFGVYYKRKYGQMNDAKTVYFGAYTSDKLIRVYDKNIESKGQVNAIRYEGQYRNALAQIYFDTLFSDKEFEANIQTVSNYAIGSVKFIERTNEVVSRCEVLADWGNFCERVGQAIKVTAKRVIRTIQQKMDWVEKQVAGTLALCALCIGLDDTMEWLERHIRVNVRKISQGSNEFFKSYRDKKIVENIGFSESLKLKKRYDRNQLTLEF